MPTCLCSKNFHSENRGNQLHPLHIIQHKNVVLLIPFSAPSELTFRRGKNLPQGLVF